jgi:hypothetical protein
VLTRPSARTADGPARLPSNTEPRFQYSMVQKPDYRGGLPRMARPERFELPTPKFVVFKSFSINPLSLLDLSTSPLPIFCRDKASLGGENQRYASRYWKPCRTGEHSPQLLQRASPALSDCVPDRPTCRSRFYCPWPESGGTISLMVQNTLRLLIATNRALSCVRFHTPTPARSWKSSSSLLRHAVPFG